MDDLIRRVKSVAEKAASREEILPFLSVCVMNMHLSLLNLLLVYEQNPDAKTVCGKAAWERMGRTIKSDAISIKIMFPKIAPGQKEKYIPVRVYDYGCTEGADREKNHKKIVFADRITQLTGATWELVPEEALKDSFDKGFYDEEKNVFYLSEMCFGTQQEQIILGLYIDYLMQKSMNKDKLVKMAVSYVVYERFGLKHTIVKALFGKLGKLSADEKWEFLKEVKSISKTVIDDLDGYTLDFNETAILNNLMNTDEPKVIKELLVHAAECVCNDDLREELLLLTEKIVRIKADCITEIWQKKSQMQLYSFPPFSLEMDDRDYLLEERRLYYAE